MSTIKMKALARLVIPAIAALTVPALVASASIAVPTAQSQHSAVKAAGKPASKSAAKAATKSPITFSITSRIRRGNLVVTLDDKPVFNEKFQKPVYLISQTTRWDPVQVTAGAHKLIAKVYTDKGKTYLSGVYNLEVSRTKGIELRFRMKGEALTVEPVSQS